MQILIGPRPVSGLLARLVAVSCLVAVVSCTSTQTGLEAGPARSADGVEIAYEVSGSGDPTVVLVHCGFCDQSVWRLVVGPLSKHYRVVTLDLAGHGASGAERETWSLDAFAGDVRAVLDAVGARKVVMVGSSLGGAVSLAAAQAMPDRVEAVIGVDTYQDVARPPVRPEVMRRQLAPLLEDFVGMCPLMVKALLPDDPDPAVSDEMTQLMCSGPPDRAHAILTGILGWRPHDVMANLEIPVRAINGSKIPTDIEAIRTRVDDFDAVVIDGVGHFPMLESPKLFTDHLIETIESLEQAGD